MASELTLPEAFRFEVVDELMRDLEVGDESVLQEIYGLLPGGPQMRELSGDTVQLDTLLNTRGLAQSVLGIQDWPKAQRFPLAEGRVNLIKIAERVEYTTDEMKTLRQIGGTSADHDRLGRAYADEQMEDQRRRLARTRDTALGGMLTDSLHLKPNGNAFLVRLSSAGGAKKVSFQIPAAHKTQLGGIIVTAWNANGAKIISDKEKIFEQAGKDSGRVPNLWHMNPTTYSSVFLNEGNTQLKDLGGSVNRWIVDQVFDPIKQVKRVRVKGMEDVELHVHYRTVDIDGTMTNIWSNNVVSMTPAPSRSWLRGVQGSRSIRLPGEAEPSERFGMLQYWDWLDDKTEAALAQYLSDVFLQYANEDDIWVATVIF